MHYKNIHWTTKYVLFSKFSALQFLREQNQVTMAYDFALYDYVAMSGIICLLCATPITLIGMFINDDSTDFWFDIIFIPILMCMWNDHIFLLREILLYSIHNYYEKKYIDDPTPQNLKYYQKWTISLIHAKAFKYNQHHNDQCSICLEPLKENIIVLFCGHIFHSECIHHYESQTIYNQNNMNQCPFCRTPYGLILDKFDYNPNINTNVFWSKYISLNKAERDKYKTNMNFFYIVGKCVDLMDYTLEIIQKLRNNEYEWIYSDFLIMDNIDNIPGPS